MMLFLLLLLLSYRPLWTPYMGRSEVLFHTRSPLIPRGPTAYLLRPAVPGGIAAFPLSRLCMIELRVVFLEIRTEIHTADSGRSPKFSPPVRISAPWRARGLQTPHEVPPFQGYSMCVPPRTFTLGVSPWVKGYFHTWSRHNSRYTMSRAPLRDPTGCRSILSGHTHFGVRHGPGDLYT